MLGVRIPLISSSESFNLVLLPSSSFRFNLYLVGGLAFGIGTLFWSISAGYFWGYPTPYYLMTNDKPVKWAEDDE